MSTRRPNLLFVLSDEHRYDCFGATWKAPGEPVVRTPAIDSIAGDGTVYDHAYCTLPICTPSRYSILSGLYVRQHGGWNNRSTLAPEHEAFPRRLRDAGCNTAAVGKMHFTPTYLDVGFDRMTLAEQAGEGKYEDDYHRFLLEAGQFDALDYIDQTPDLRARAGDDYWAKLGTARSSVPEEYHSTTWVGDRAIDELSRWDESGGNVLMVGFVKPHHPFDAPEPWASLYNPDQIDPLPGWSAECLPHDLAYRDSRHFDPATMTESAVRAATALYFAMISQIDHHIGRMVDVLIDRGLYEDTMIIYTSDHGEYLGFHHMITKGNLMYDPVVRVPCVIKYPGEGHRSRPAAGVNTGLFSLVDLYPTILAAMGLDDSGDRPGINMRSHPEGREAVCAEIYEGKEYMVRTKTHKLLELERPRSSHLFDLRTDHLEMHDVIEDPEQTETLNRLRDRLLHWTLFEAVPPVHRDKDAPLSPCASDKPIGPEVRAETERRFRSLVEPYLSRAAGSAGPGESEGS